MKRWTRLDWLSLLIFAALVALFFWRILTPNPADRQSFPPGDFYAQFWAFTTFDARQLTAGRLPLWNPYTFAGAPFWADVQAAVFYPLSLLTVLLSAPWGFSAFALELEAIFHFWLAATFMYLFSREITGNQAAGVVAALVWTFGGYLTGYPSQQLAVLEVDVWLPLILFFLHQAGQQTAGNGPQPANGKSRQRLPFRRSVPYLILAGVAWGLALLAGHPQSYLIVSAIASAYLLFLWGQESENAERGGENTPAEVRHSPFAIRNSQFIVRLTQYASRALPAMLVFLLTGLAVAAIQFIPAVEYTLQSVRAAGTYEKMSGGFPLVDLVQMLLPGQVSVYSPLYVGVVGLILAGWVLIAAPTRHIVFWAAVAGLALLISFGGNTFLYSPLYLWIPGFSIFRGQERWTMAFAFSLSVLVGYGFKQLLIINDQLSTEAPLKNRNLSPLLQFTRYLFLFAVLLTLAFFFGLTNTGWTPNSPFYGLLGAATRLTLVTALVWLAWKLAPQLSGSLLAILIGALICFDLFSVNWQTNLYPQPPQWHTQMPAAVQAIKADAAQTPDRPYRVYNEFRLFDNYGVPYEIEDLWGSSPLRLARYDGFLSPPMPIERAWELLNVKYVVTWRKELYVPSTIIYQEPAADGVTYVHRLGDVGPRAWLVNQVERAGDAAILQKIADPGFDRWHIALLEKTTESANLPVSTSANGEIQNSSFPTPDHIIHHVSTDAPALLILSEIYYTGWQATVDGQPASLLRADYVLRAVPVPAGEHTVELTFRPLSFTIGAIVSGLALVLIVAVLGVVAWQMHRGQP